MDRPISPAALTGLSSSACAGPPARATATSGCACCRPRRRKRTKIWCTATPTAAHCLADHGIAVLDAEICRLYPDNDLHAAEPALAAAVALGAAELLVAAHDPDEARLTDRFGAFCDQAARHDLNVSLEFMPWTEAATWRRPRASCTVAAEPMPACWSMPST